METWSLLLEVVVLLAACLLVGGIFSALKQNPLVGYLLAGMLLGGPGSLNVVRSESHIDAIAELGVALLLFSLGLEFSWNRLLGLGRKTLAGGVVQVVLTGAAAAGVVLLFRLGPAEAVAVGAMVSLSSTATVLRVLIDRGEIDGYYGRNSLAILLVQDIAVVPLAVLMTLLGGRGEPADVFVDVLKILGLAAALVLGFYLLINKAAVRALQFLSVEKNRELTVLLAVVVGFGATWGAHAIGVSPALGAFLAGMFLGSSPFATQIRADVSSLRVVLLTLFFGAVGMVADPLWIASHLPLVLGFAAAIVLFKALIVWGILRAIGQPDGISLATGLCLAQIGEFAFVLGKTAKSVDAIGTELYMLVVSVAIVTLFLTPYLVAAAPWAALTFQRWRGGLAPSDESRLTHAAFQPDVVIVGFGPAGQAVGRAFVGGDTKVLVIDLNSAAKSNAESLGLHAEIGDATSRDVLQHAGAASAKVVAITLPARAAALTVLDHVRSLNPAAWIVVRSRYQNHEPEFQQAGADVIIGDEAEVGQRLAEGVKQSVADSRP
jgi:CPA2 family monovalent cation:H+ antiporter-2